MMTMKDHLSRAKDYLAKGEQFYRKAAEEMSAAKDEGATWAAIGDAVGHSDRWVKDIVAWYKTPANRGRYTGDLPFAEEKGSVAKRHAKSVLRDAPLEQVEQIIASLPKDRQQAIAAAAGHQYMKARQEYDDRERSLTSAEKREREQAGERLTRPIRQAVAGFAALGIIAHLEQATEELRELTADGSLVPKVMRQIDRATDAWITELEFAKQMVGDDE